LILFKIYQAFSLRVLRDLRGEKIYNAIYLTKEAKPYESKN